MADVIVNDPFHRALRFALVEQIEQAKSRLASGSAAMISADSASVAEKYAAQTSRITAYLEVLDLCQLIERNMLDGGVRPADVKVVER